jgi:hypothetical protein
VVAVAGPRAHDDVLDHPLRRLLADGLGGGAGQVALEAHGELAVAFAQLVGAGVATVLGRLARNWDRCYEKYKRLIKHFFVVARNFSDLTSHK